jgi:lysophospholipid hydrolase
MVRLQRVTFTALHQYLGLSAELVNQGSHKKKQSPFSGSPVRSRTRENFASQNIESVSSIFPIGMSEIHDTSEVSYRDVSNSSTSQPVPIINRRRE